MADGQRLAAALPREMGSTEIYPQLLQHSPNGRFVTVCGDGEYIIYTALAWRNKAFGAGTGFAWSHDSNTYAVKESAQRLRLFRSFKERAGLLGSSLGYSIEDIKGGALLAVIGAGFVCFYDWESGGLVRRIDVEAKEVSDSFDEAHQHPGLCFSSHTCASSLFATAAHGILSSFTCPRAPPTARAHSHPPLPPHSRSTGPAPASSSRSARRTRSSSSALTARPTMHTSTRACPSTTRASRTRLRSSSRSAISE